MIPTGHLKADLAAFGQIINELAAIAGRSDPARRSELVTLRKKLSDHIARMRNTGIQAFTDAGEADLANEFRSRLSKILNLVAMHQANWPAVAINEGNAAYRASAAKVAEGNRAFIDWSSAAIARLG